ncbi:phosphate ABC transporter permease PstA [Pseudoxanthomonas mexicana]|uniref:phosphate ABC transporter permease PstA n=1 Tax=Pseudoxanthomonas mexicana TaxID=128785 RepID=UPI00398B6C6A
MSVSLYGWRRLKNAVALTLSIAAALFGLMWLVWILWTTISKGLGSLNLDLFTMMTPPPNEPGGLANAIFGSVAISLTAIALGTPIGIAAGTWLAEYANRHWLGETIRFVNDILLSAPSIVLGLFVYTLMVAQMGHYSAWAGAVALAFIALPVIVRTTDEMLRLVPQQMREAALSLGVPQWKVTTQVLMRSALPGIVTGILLALARISGETAPLLFTAFNNQFWSTDMNASMANLPMVIYQYAMSPYDSWNSLAWAGALLVTVLVLLLSLSARLILLRNKIAHD